MQKVFYIFFFIATFLYGQSDKLGSHLVIESESLAVKHESAYGATNSYSFLVAEHQLKADRHLLLYYGTKVGFVSEACTGENGFVPGAKSLGTVIEANIGMHYSLKNFRHISLEGNHIQDAHLQQTQRQFKIGYHYRF
ncbi:MAG: hypothetical protein MUP09_02310 [Thiovulaceae bacterium]|nr:hypothetical protein [Sulfurimonadaceae bacterium]